ncbi:DUF1080 domain-containing protein [Gramella sp. AN32]|uniref:DUF1080 domain-containing protein n=1 Tax=Christiangramia antarctica TaxID=2058158 RepID=A0ABW5XAM2_9FLAO|nr:DUF1080 domain-containing protein [Gramella sp. AN32]MCM4156568.1 DUF1080 domain-containing protein [Gramella sp. AN32]
MKRTILALGCATLIFASCKNETKKTDDSEMDNTEEMTNAEDMDQAGEWQVLFDGKNMDEWKAFNSDTVSSQWKIEGDALAFTPAEGDRAGSENLITKESFGDFELEMEWKISEGGNSGIMWGVQEGDQYSEPYLTGPEIQVLDNERHPDAKNGPNRTAGALYDMVPPSEDVTKPAGEWNKVVIRIDHENNIGSVTQNGTEIVTFEVNGEGWDKMVANSKFKDWEDFGASKTGHIALQDHGNKVWFRNIRIKEL